MTMSHPKQGLIFVIIALAVVTFVCWNFMPYGRVVKHGYQKFAPKAGSYSMGVPTGKEMSDANASRTKHIPQAIIAGIKKCGTGALRSFLNFHPSVVAAKSEVHYFDRHYSDGMNWYLDQMPEARDDQMTVEKTPRYFVEAEVPGKIYREFSPKTKIVLIACEPVRRAVSDYVHTDEKVIYAKEFLRTGNSSSPEYQKQKDRLERYPREGYVLKDSFESTVLDKQGNVNESTPVVYTGLYVKYLRNWLQFFPRSQIHVVDGENFKTDPATEMAKLQTFLGLEPFFYEDKFLFDRNKGFFCFMSPKKRCLGKSKGHTHPEVDSNVFEILTKYYEPYNEEFSQVLNQSFVWTKS